MKGVSPPRLAAPTGRSDMPGSRPRGGAVGDMDDLASFVKLLGDGVVRTVALERLIAKEKAAEKPAIESGPAIPEARTSAAMLSPSTPAFAFENARQQVSVLQPETRPGDGRRETKQCFDRATSRDRDALVEPELSLRRIDPAVLRDPAHIAAAQKPEVAPPIPAGASVAVSTHFSIAAAPAAAFPCISEDVVDRFDPDRVAQTSHVESIGEQAPVAVAVGAKTHVVVVDLAPDALGPVRVRMELSRHTLRMRLETEHNGAARDLLSAKAEIEELITGVGLARHDIQIAPAGEQAGSAARPESFEPGRSSPDNPEDGGGPQRNGRGERQRMLREDHSDARESESDKGSRMRARDLLL
jgi:hypothetical protein